MQYFDTLPKIIETDNVGVSRVFTNLMARASIIPDVLKNPLVYYSYDIQEGDTPEIVAYKYYGDSYRYWIVLFANELLDPQWSWPMDSTVFDSYMAEKYPSGNTTTTVYSYEKKLTQTDNSTNTVTINTIDVNQTEYNSIIQNTETYSIGNSTVTVATTKRIVTIYDYEYELNESKRKINILNSVYVDQMESQFKSLMSQ
ncbi:MAG: baseplate wedge protein 53 [Terrimicrobiaceae bacterium]|jgi:hypothetical protein